jgi:hypothetical protein
MADNELRIGIRVDTGALDAGMAEAKAQVAATADSMKASFASAGAAVKSSADQMAQSLKAQGLSADDAALAMKGLGFSSEEAGAALATAGLGMRAVSAETDRATQSVARLRSGFVLTGSGVRVVAREMSSNIALFGAAIAAMALSTFVKDLTQFEIKLDDVARATGNTATAMGALAAAVEPAGVDIDQLNGILDHLEKQADKAAIGGKEAAREFSQFGISVDSWNGKVPNAIVLLDQITDSLQKNKGNGETATIALRLLGGEATKLIPVLQDMKGSLKDNMLANADLAVAEGDNVQSARDVEKAWADLTNTFKEAALPALKALAETMKGLNFIVHESIAGFRLFADAVSGPVGAMKILGSATDATTEKLKNQQAVLSGIGKPSKAPPKEAGNEKAKDRVEQWQEGWNQLIVAQGVGHEKSLEDEQQYWQGLLETAKPNSRELEGIYSKLAEIIQVRTRAGAEAAKQALSDQKEQLNESVRAAQQAANAQLEIADKNADSQVHSGQSSPAQWESQQMAALLTWYNQQKAVLAQALDDARQKFGAQSDEYRRLKNAESELDNEYLVKFASALERGTALQQTADEKHFKSLEDQVRQTKELADATLAADQASSERPGKHSGKRGGPGGGAAVDLSSIQDWRSAQLAALNDWYASQKVVLDKALADMKAHGQQGTDSYKNMLTQEETLDQQFNKRREQLDTQTNDAIAANWKKMWSTINSDLNQSVSGMIRGTETMQQSFARLGSNMVISMAQGFVKMLEAWVKTQIEMLAGMKITDAAEAAHSLKSITKSAYTAAAHAYADVPFPLNLVVAPAVFATVMGLSVASAEGGWGSVPADDTMARLHFEEMVLPRPEANIIRQLADDGGGANGPVHVHVHYGSVSAIDARGMEDVLSKHADAVGKAALKHLRSRNLIGRSG